MQKKIFNLVFIFVFISLFISPIKVNGVENNLITIGEGKYNITITSETKISTISSVLGEPKLVTDSAFGGQAYTFYTDDDYNNYLYIETSSRGNIVSYGSIDSTFKTNDGSYNDDYSKYAYQGSRLRGYYYAKDSKVIGGIFYYPRGLGLDTNNHEKAAAEFFVNNYQSNQTKYLKGISEQATLMFNALIKKFGKEGNIKFDEETFYINEQLKEFNSSIRDYAKDTEKMSKYGYRISADNTNIDANYWLLNPLLFSKALLGNLVDYDEFKTKDIGVFDFDSNKNLLTVMTIDKKMYDDYKNVALTEEEQEKLDNGRAKYKSAIENLNKEDKIYSIEPIIDVASNLRAGKLVESKRKGITDYVNAIRAGAGLGILQDDDDCFDVAQHISVLSSYRYTVLGLDIRHKPPQPEGVTTEFYRTAVAWERAMAENIGNSKTQSDMSKVDGQDMMSHINTFLDDRTEVGGLFFSHRQKVLAPTVTKFGYGVSPYMYSNEFGSVIDTDINFVSWPSNGITFLETLDYRNFYWTIEFFNDYQLTDTATVKIKNLRTDEVWEFNEEEGSSKATRWYELNTRENELIMYDNTINPTDGDIYEITVYNVIDETKSKTINFTYRSIFKYADINNVKTDIKSLKISVPDNVTKVDNNYYVGLDEEVKLSALINDNSVTEKLLTWTSSNPNIISVTQNGIIKVLKRDSNPIEITVKNNFTNLSSTITIIPDTYETMSLNYSEYQFNSLDETLNVNATLTNGNVPSVTWSTSNDGVVEVKDGKITPLSGGYTEVYATSTKYGTRRVKIYVAVPVTLEDGSKLYVGDVDGDGRFSMNDAAIIIDYYNNGISEDMAKVADINKDGKVNTIDSNMILDFSLSGSDGFHPGEYKHINSVNLNKDNVSLSINGNVKLNATIAPLDTTDSPKLTWSSSNDAVAHVDNNGKVTAKSDGTAIITVKTSNNKVATCKVIVGTGISKYIRGDLTRNGSIEVSDATEALLKTIEELDTTEEDLLIADFDENGKINASDATEILLLYINSDY